MVWVEKKNWLEGRLGFNNNDDENENDDDDVNQSIISINWNKLTVLCIEF